jgi:hypothetical protein
MKVSIHCVTVGKHFYYLKYMLRSVEKFASGFTELVILCPTVDRGEMELMQRQYHGSIPLWVHYFDEWPGKGFLHHEYLVMCAEQHCRGDFIQHMDSDHVFIEPTMPDDNFVDGKPILVYWDFESLIKVQGNMKYWQENSERAFGVKDEYEFMRRAPIIHARETYPASRAEIEHHVRTPLDLFVRSQRNEFPQGFCEYGSLGSTAWRKLHDRYHWVNQPMVGELKSPGGKIRQAWSHRPPTHDDLCTYSQLGLQ